MALSEVRYDSLLENPGSALLHPGYTLHIARTSSNVEELLNQE